MAIPTCRLMTVFDDAVSGNCLWLKGADLSNSKVESQQRAGTEEGVDGRLGI